MQMLTKSEHTSYQGKKNDNLLSKVVLIIKQIQLMRLFSIGRPVILPDGMTNSKVVMGSLASLLRFNISLTCFYFSPRYPTT